MGWPFGGAGQAARARKRDGRWHPTGRVTTRLCEPARASLAGSGFVQGVWSDSGKFIVAAVARIVAAWLMACAAKYPDFKSVHDINCLAETKSIVSVPGYMNGSWWKRFALRTSPLPATQVCCGAGRETKERRPCTAKLSLRLVAL